MAVDGRQIFAHAVGDFLLRIGCQVGEAVMHGFPWQFAEDQIIIGREGFAGVVGDDLRHRDIAPAQGFISPFFARVAADPRPIVIFQHVEADHIGIVDNRGVIDDPTRRPRHRLNFSKSVPIPYCAYAFYRDVGHVFLTFRGCDFNLRCPIQKRMLSDVRRVETLPYFLQDTP